MRQVGSGGSVSGLVPGEQGCEGAHLSHVGRVSALSRSRNTKGWIG